jgi:hypothetical protein
MVTGEGGAGWARVAIAGRVVAGILGIAAVVVFVLCAWVAVSSRFELGGRDAHGYGLLFGSVLAVGAALVVAVVLPLAFARRVRAGAYQVALLCFALIVLLAVIGVMTA